MGVRSGSTDESPRLTPEEVRLLRRLPPFRSLPPKVLPALASLVQRRDYEAGQSIVDESIPLQGLLLVTAGDATLNTGSRQHRLPPGHAVHFGAADGGKLHSTLRANGPTRVLIIPKAPLDELSGSHPDTVSVLRASGKKRLRHRLPAVGALYRLHFANTRRERLFLASSSFFVTFGAVRMIVRSIREGRGPFQNVSAKGRHIHHLVWGILSLLLVGYVWLLQIGTGLEEPPRKWTRLTSLLYGAGSALTLDEFALWLDLEDVYWTPEGRASIDAVALFGSLLSMGLWGGTFFRGAFHLLTPQQRVHHA